MAKKNRIVVGAPLTPASLGEMGALEDFPSATSPFDPKGSWTNLYRVWANHGYTNDGLINVGFLKIERKPDGPGKGASLEVEQQILNDGAQIHRIRADIRCAPNSLASPVEWALSSGFAGPDGKPVPQLGLEERGRARGEEIEIETGGRTFTRKGSKRLASDWGLYDAVQRLPFRKGASLSCDALEEMSVLREGVKVSYRGVVPNPANPKESLHCFQQLSRGVLPYEYYLDARHRLALAITFSVAFILDGKAEQKTRNAFKKSQDNAKRRAQRRKGGRQ